MALQKDNRVKATALLRVDSKQWTNEKDEYILCVETSSGSTNFDSMTSLILLRLS